MILTPLLKLPKNGEYWGKLIDSKGFKKLPKIQNIAQSGHNLVDTIDPQFYLFFDNGLLTFTKKLLQSKVKLSLCVKVIPFGKKQPILSEKNK